MKRALAFALALITLATLPVYAGGEGSVLSPDEFVPEIMSDAYISEGNYAVAFMSTYDGEVWYSNEEEYFEVASVYKLPLNMYYCELENSGELDPDSTVAGIPLSRCHLYSIENSNNPVSEAMYEQLGGYTAFKRLILPYTGYTEDELQPDYYNENAFTARMVLNILRYAWDNQQDFSELIDHMLAAQPGEYLESGSFEGEIAQKYGYDSYDGVLHVAVAGIVYAGSPFLIAVLTRGSYAAVDAMGKLADAFAAWDEQRIASLPEELPEETPEPEPEPELDMDAVRNFATQMLVNACYAAPEPALLPWDEIINLVLASS